MNIVITRHRKTSETIDGRLTIEGMRICDCAENAKRAIKAGIYPVVITKCHQHARKQPCVIVNGSPKCSTCNKLEGVSNNSNMPQYCPQLCQGNGVYNRNDGAIIVGSYLAPGCLAHPKEAFEAIYDRLRKSAERGHDITLEIVEAYPKPVTHDLTPYQMGCQILTQMGNHSNHSNYSNNS